MVIWSGDMLQGVVGLASLSATEIVKIWSYIAQSYLLMYLYYL